MWFRSADLTHRRLNELGQAVSRIWGWEPFPVQLQAAVALSNAVVVELETGQGKTLIAAMAACLQALSGRTVWLATANDYLARRDADWMQPLFAELGLRAAVLCTGQTAPERESAERADIVYGTLKEFGFGLLRRNAARSGARNSRSQPKDSLDLLQRSLIVDEADSLLIDEATTPLILSRSGSNWQQSNEALFRWGAQQAVRYQAPADYELDPQTGRVTLTAAGHQWLLTGPLPDNGDHWTQHELKDALVRAIEVRHRLVRDRDYLIREDRVILLDEFTGRTAEGRNWEGGRQQAVEAAEGLPLTPQNETVCRITVPELVARFGRCSGLTGTAWEARDEFRSLYGLKVKRFAPHQPSQRKEIPTVLLPTAAQHREAIANEAARMASMGRAVLIGTRTVGRSEMLSEALTQHGLSHEVLNARQIEHEAAIIAQAGQPGQITIATNMAGRGTDIGLADSVRDAGGLHVIGAELNASARIDRQLAGRCGRQGDPGSFGLILSAGDSLLTADGMASHSGAVTLADLLNARQTLEQRARQSRVWLTQQAERNRFNRALLGLADSSG